MVANKDLDTFMAWIPLVWYQQRNQPYVTPGNRGAAVVAGFNIIIFTTIAYLAHKDKLKRRREGSLTATSYTAELHSSRDVSDKKGQSDIGVYTVEPKAAEGRKAAI